MEGEGRKMRRARNNIIFLICLFFSLPFLSSGRHSATASDTSPFFNYYHHEQSKKITKGLPEDLHKQIIVYLPQKDVLSLSGVSKTV
jgi:hypothetical protein